MQKLVIELTIIASMQTLTTYIPKTAPTHQETPAYAKWGQVAVKETQSKFPHASIIDYLYEGSEPKENSTIEKFRLRLKESDKEFGVSVKIEYFTDTNELIHVQIHEVSD
ncbi:DUF3889 domain-containing protein [Psychrobacillus sp. FSL K6-4615]|uniref:DUF3889 domain-containing protein n=1 Tax=Psychrobacillus sp. FSL K6-4615 TaxID=2921551 RepID=UPI0030F61E85